MADPQGSSATAGGGPDVTLRVERRGLAAYVTLTRPEVGETSPMMVAMVVVLPAPLPPKSAVIDPAASVNEMPSTAGTVL